MTFIILHVGNEGTVDAKTRWYGLPPPTLPPRKKIICKAMPLVVNIDDRTCIKMWILKHMPTALIIASRATIVVLFNCDFHI